MLTQKFCIESDVLHGAFCPKAHNNGPKKKKKTQIRSKGGNILVQPFIIGHQTCTSEQMKEAWSRGQKQGSPL